MDSERPSDTYDDDEIDLRRYVAILFRRWRLIVTLAALAVMAAGLVALTSAPPYEAVAGVAIVKSRTELVFDPKFVTVTGDTGTTVAASSDAQRNALLGLVQNGTIATQMVAQLGSKLEPSERNPSMWLTRVKGELVQKGDLIQIKVTDANPQKAADIANAWAQEYERLINGIYSGAPTEYSASVDTELKRAKQEYGKTQADLEVFIAKNKVDELNRFIAEKQYIIGALQMGKQAAVSTVVSEELKARTQIIAAYLSAQATDKLLAFQKEQEGRRGLVTAQMDAQNNARLVVFNQQAQANLQTLANYYDTRLRTGRLLNDARNMREQVRTGEMPPPPPTGWP